MNKREMAEQIVAKMKNVKQIKISDYSVIYEPTAIQLAKVCVHFILNANPHSNHMNTNTHSTMEYWLGVQEEINKL